MVERWRSAFRSIGMSRMQMMQTHKIMAGGGGKIRHLLSKHVQHREGTNLKKSYHFYKGQQKWKTSSRSIVQVRSNYFHTLKNLSFLVGLSLQTGYLHTFSVAFLKLCLCTFQRFPPCLMALLLFPGQKKNKL